jgi:DNA-binding LytR/AlgR family response regulator
VLSLLELRSQLHRVINFSQAKFVKPASDTVNSVSLQLAHRELQRVFRDRRLIVGLIGLGLVFGFAGPFGTDTSLSLAPRLLYWLAIVVVTGLSGWIFTRFFSNALCRLGVSPLFSALFGGALAGVPITLIVHAINIAFLAMPLADLTPSFAALTGTIVAISATVSTAMFLITLGPTPQTPQTPQSTAPIETANSAPRLLTRLPYEKRGALLSLSALDHYTEVVTTTGKELVLIRLADAIAEASPVCGLQIHRSHWVALSAIARLDRDASRLILTVSDGRTLPVSRSNFSILKEAGILPGRTNG